MKTEKRHGRTTDDLRSVVHSIVLATLPPPGEKAVSDISASKALGIPKSTYQRIVKAVKQKRIAIEDEDRSIIFSQVLKRRGNKKLTAEQVERIQEFVRNHEMVVASPISNDLIQIPDKNDPGRMIKTTKLLLQCSVRELHNDLVKEDWVKS